MKILTTLLLTSISFQSFAGDFDASIFKVEIKNTPQKIKLLNHGLASLEERLQLIESATKSIDVEYFIYNADKSGRIFTQALIKKAKEGVKVRLLLDFFMVKSQITPFHAEELEKIGIEVKYFNPTSTLNLGKGQYRNHRKVLIIDGKVAITGGRNIGDDYFDLSPHFNFLDRDLTVSGPLVESMQETYDAVWNSAPSKKVAKSKMPQEKNYQVDESIFEQLNYESDVKEWNEKVKAAQDFVASENLDSSDLEQIRAKGKEELVLEYQGECNDMTYHSEYPIISKKNRVQRIIKLDLYDRIKNAKKSVVFDSPYFIPEKNSTEALNVALGNNVEIKLLTNGLNSTDAVYVFDVFDAVIGKWVEKGIDPYVFKGDRPANYEVLNEEIAHARFGVHAKSFIFDDKDVVIGTFNFDPRSSNFNTEMVVSCDNNPELAQIVKADIDSRMEASIHINTKEAINSSRFFRVGLMKKLQYLVLKLPSIALDYLL